MKTTKPKGGGMPHDLEDAKREQGEQILAVLQNQDAFRAQRRARLLDLVVKGLAQKHGIEFDEGENDGDAA